MSYRSELVKVAAIAVSMIEAHDKRVDRGSDGASDGFRRFKHFNVVSEVVDELTRQENELGDTRRNDRVNDEQALFASLCAIFTSGREK